MNLQTRVERLEQSSGPASEDCPLCVSREAKATIGHERAPGLQVVEGWEYPVKCLRCGSPFTIQVDCAESADANAERDGYMP